MKLNSRTGDIALGAVSIAAGVVILFLTKLQGLEFLKNGMPGAGMFPTICAAAIIVCGALLLVESVRSLKKASGGEEPDPEREENIINTWELKNLLVFLLLGGMVLVLSEYIGMLTCLGLSIIIYIKVQGKDPLWKAVAVGAGAVVFLYLVFVTFLRVPLPKGPFGF